MRLILAKYKAVSIIYSVPLCFVDEMQSLFYNNKSNIYAHSVNCIIFTDVSPLLSTDGFPAAAELSDEKS